MYAIQSDIESQFGITNVADWSQLDPTQSGADANRIQAALDYADARIVSTFASFGNYATPLAPIGSDALLVTRWAAILAGVWLYQSRGLRDDDPLGNHLTQLKAQVESEMRTYLSTQKLNATPRWPSSNAPVGY